MKPIFNRNPLTPNRLSPLPAGYIRPEGWLKDMLKKEAEGIVNDFFTLTKEECPPDAAACRLELLILFGRLLQDDELMAQADEGISELLESVREDGWFGEGEQGDYWSCIRPGRSRPGGA